MSVVPYIIIEMSVDPTLTVDAVTNVIVQAKYPQILGLYLPGLKKELLQIIEQENCHNQLQLARKISKAWINNRIEEATWEKLIIALEVGIVGENYLAEQVRSDIHIRRDSTTSTGSSLTNSFASLSTGSDLFSSENEGTVIIIIYLLYIDVVLQYMSIDLFILCLFLGLCRIID